MSDDEADLELLDFLRQHFQKSSLENDIPETRVLESAEYVYNNSIDVAIDSRSTKAAANMIYEQMQIQNYSTQTWAEHELHPKTRDESTVNFIFTMDLLNFCFWSDKNEEERFAVDYRGKTWKGYWSLVAALQRALDEGIGHEPMVTHWLTIVGIPITSSDFWQDENECTEIVLQHVFRSCTDEPIPLLSERISCLREAGRVLYTSFSCSPTVLVQSANGSAARLVNVLAREFSCFNDVVGYENRSTVKLMKRAQIFVADIWAAFDGQGIGKFVDVDKITMFADYRVPQVLNALGCLWYAPGLERRIKEGELFEPGDRMEVQMRGNFKAFLCCRP